QGRQTGPDGRGLDVAEKARVPELFKLPLAGIAPDEFAPVPLDDDQPDGDVAPKYWLFGQWNKYLPAKATVRGLLNLLGAQRDGVPVSEATRRISGGASLLGDYLHHIDLRNEVTRENALATAFPATSGSGGPGQSRFAN